MTRDELLRNIERDRATLDALIDEIDAETRVQPVLEGARSVKDVLAHVTAWEQRCLSKMRDDAQGLKQPAGAGLDEDGVDHFNDAIFEANRGRSWDDVTSESTRSYAQMLAAVEALDDAALRRTVRWGEDAGQPLWQEVSWDSDAHYREHVAQIRAWQAAGARG